MMMYGGATKEGNKKWWFDDMKPELYIPYVEKATPGDQTKFMTKIDTLWETTENMFYFHQKVLLRKFKHCHF